MYDYSVTKADKQQFIRTFFKIGDKITIIFGDGKPYNIPYSDTAIKNLNRLMHQQVKDTNVTSMRAKSIGHATLTIGSSIMTSIYATYLTSLTPNIMIPLTTGALTVYGLIKSFSYSLKTRNLEKNKLFVDMEAQLNLGAKMFPEMFNKIEANLPKRTVTNNGYHFNLTDVDYMSYKTLKTMRHNMDQAEFKHLRKIIKDSKIEIAPQKKLIKVANFNYKDVINNEKY